MARGISNSGQDGDRKSFTAEKTWKIGYQTLALAQLRNTGSHNLLKLAGDAAMVLSVITVHGA
jgi:hypothetical protein